MCLQTASTCTGRAGTALTLTLTLTPTLTLALPLPLPLPLTRHRAVHGAATPFAPRAVHFIAEWKPWRWPAERLLRSHAGAPSELHTLYAQWWRHARLTLTPAQTITIALTLTLTLTLTPTLP